MDHPREPGPGLSLDRRAFLAAAVGTVPAAAALMAACRSPDPGIGTDQTIPPAAQAGPLPLFEGIEPIADGLDPEPSAKLRVYGWGPTYFSPKLLAAFEERHGCTIDFIPFRTMEEGLARLRTGTFEVDVFVPTVKVIRRLASARMLRPLNYSYIEHLGDVWPSLADPSYDPGPRYTVPYFVWTIGTSWRNDLVSEEFKDAANPYDVFWDPAHRGHIHVLNSVQDLVGMALLRNGDDPNTDDPAAIERARHALLDMVDAVRPSVDSNDYRDLFSGAALLHQSWSGNLAYAKHYAPTPSDIERLSYWWPPSGGSGKPGLKGSDVLVVMANARNPVLAHHFIDAFLQPDSAFTNSVYNGYQAPVSSVTAERLIEADAVPANLRSIIVTPEDFAHGTQEMELAPDADNLFHKAYDDVVRAAERASASPTPAP